ncbi:DGQHR domain-containing protein [Curtobacterium flaccumfaciens pv. flaccumfaciens]|uniref:DGQHR domain-containing protein n=1 Tax=Curtobacterium flaccumfaciens TaxID=2035 RepID=UPI0039A19616
MILDGETTNGAALKIETTRRLSEYVRSSFKPSLREAMEGEGWEFDRQMKTSVRMRRSKSHDVAFEDRVWAMFARVGFDTLNKGRNFRLKWDVAANAGKQIDVFAADDETIVVVECKSSGAKVPPSATFKDEVDIIRGYRTDLLPILNKEFPGKKVRFVLATNNFAVSDEAIERMEALQISYIDERVVEYYLALAEHLGPAAKYQLLATLFKGVRIPGLEAEVAAIQGRMGGTEYFTFMIEPSRLLKLSYVLHKNSTTGRSLQTYQRIIKRTRLKKVQAFVDTGGYFPNSLVINIDSGGRALQFDRGAAQGGRSRLGVLHLPQTYGSAYIIDGQHRLYGFAGAERADAELIPVVAFVDMKPDEQVRLFMQINENQQAVPKNLRNTLNSDLLWHSSSMSDQSKALRLRIAQHLGEEKTSVLAGRIVLGEDKATKLRCVSIDAITRGLDRGGYVGEFTAHEMKKSGTFFRGTIDRTVRPLSLFGELLFEYLSAALPHQWALGRAEGGFVFINNGVEALLRVVGDLITHAEHQGRINPKAESPRVVLNGIKPELDHIVAFLATASREAAQELRTSYGSAGATKYWRRLQLEVARTSPDFAPQGLAEYRDDQLRRSLEEARELLDEVAGGLRSGIRDQLEGELGADWWREALPQGVFERAHAERAKAVFEGGFAADVDWWEFVNVEDLEPVFETPSVRTALVGLFPGTHDQDRDAVEFARSLVLTVKSVREDREVGPGGLELLNTAAKLLRSEDELQVAVTSD